MNISGSDRCRIRTFFSIFIPVNELKNTYFMQTNNEYLDEWPVRPYSKRELAMAYAPISVRVPLSTAWRDGSDIIRSSAMSWMRQATKTGSGFSPPCKWN